MSPRRLLRQLVLGLTLIIVLAAGAGAPAAADPWRPAAASIVVAARIVPSEPATTGIAPDEADDADDPSWGWGPSRLIWAGFGWLGVVLVAALLLRRRASRRR